MSKNEQRDYVRGYNDAREGKQYKIPSVLDIVTGAVVPGVDPAGPSKAYDQGYKDGKEDKKR